jgi:vacuolar-type H+-ATPase subunit H
MSRRRNARAPEADTLDRLLEAESRIEGRLEECRVEAARLVEAARTEAARQEGLLEAKLRQERAQRIRSREAEIDEMIRVQRTRAVREIRRLRSLSPGQIQAISRKVIEHLLPESPA